MQARYVAGAVALMLMPAAGLAKPSDMLPPVRYVCEDGTRLRVTYTAPGHQPSSAMVEVLGTGKRWTLGQTASADGGRYEAADVTIWDKGQTAAFSQGGKALSCRAKR